MRIALYSDLHLELAGGAPWQPPLDLDADVVVLAGDIHRTTRGLRWAASAFRRESRAAPAIVYVAGNREFYGSSLGMLRELRKPEWQEQGVYFLERETYVLEDLRAVGCTLWSGFTLHGTGSAMAAAMRLARYTIADYSVISPAGFWTIGYGHLCDAAHPLITEVEAEVYLAHDLQTALAAALRYCPVLATEREWRLAAIVDFTFNLGARRLQASTLRRRINQGHHQLVASELEKWVLAAGRRLPGLIVRRHAEALLYG